MNNKVCPITRDIAYKFVNINEIASKSYAFKDKEIKEFYIDLAKSVVDKYEKEYQKSVVSMLHLKFV